MHTTANFPRRSPAGPASGRRWRIAPVCFGLVAAIVFAAMPCGPALAVSPSPYLIECRFALSVIAERYRQDAFLIRLANDIKSPADTALADNECRWADASRPGDAESKYRTLRFCCAIYQPTPVLARLKVGTVKLLVTTSFARDAKPDELEVVSYPR